MWVSMKMIRAGMAGMVVCGACSANVAGGGDGSGRDVTLREEGDSIVLDNGIVSIRINRTDATLTSFTYQGLNLFAGGHGGGKFYWSWNAPAYGGPHGEASLSVDPKTNHGEYAEVKIHSPWSGKPGEAAMDVDIYYSLKRGAQGYYVTAMLHHPASYPRTELGEWRSNAYLSPIFDWLSVDDLRQRQMPTMADMAAALPVTGAPKEVTRLTSGLHAGEYECKYAYSADLGNLDVWGWSSTSKRVGVWMTVPSHEFYNGGPMKRELTAHMNHTLLNMLNGSHYGMGTQLIMAAGTEFSKTFGPYFIYANSYQGASEDPTAKVVKSLWRDAQAQAKAEQAAWPYNWFRHPGYTLAAGRALVTGRLHVRDKGNPAAKSAGAWIGLAPDDQGVDFQMQGRTYQFWVKTAADGSFQIPNVLPGVYQLYAFGAGNIGTFKQNDIAVSAGQSRDLGTLTWVPDRVASTLWEIGVPDRDAREFHNGEFNYTQWATYARSLAQADRGVNYTIGASDWRTDWDYTQFGSSPWNVHFNLSATPSADAAISLYLALASSETTLMVSVNDHKVATYKAPQPAHAAVRLGSHGPFSETRIAIPAGLLRRGENTIAIVQLLAKDKQGTTQYDYLRLEADGVQLVQPVAHLPASAAATRASSQ